LAKQTWVKHANKKTVGKPHQPSSPSFLQSTTQTGKAQAFNDLFELDTSNPEQYKWRQIVCNPAPPARARHIAVAVRI
jgi:hypothetical protein